VPQTTLAEAAALWLRELPYLTHSKGGTYAPGTVRSYTDQITLFIRAMGDLDLHDLTPQDISRHYATMRTAGRRDQYIQTRDKAVRVFLKWCVEERKLLPVSPLDRVPRQQAADPPVVSFTEDDLRRLLRACATDTWTGVRHATMVLTLWHTGIRAAELCRLRLDEYDPKRQTLRVRGKKSAAADRTVGVPDELALALDQWILLARGRETEPDPWLFVKERGTGPLTRNVLTRIIQRIGKAAGVKPCHPHRFRHTFAVRMLRPPISMDLYHLSRLLGHARIEMTAKYLRAMQAEQAAAEHVRLSRRGGR
jgi:integrase